MGTGLGVNVANLLRVLPGFCMMDRIPVVIAMAIQFPSLGLYQLSRLHYCFSRDQVHSDKGYPFWSFMVMIVIGMVLSVSFVLIVVLYDPFALKCGWSALPGTFFFWKNQV